MDNLHLQFKQLQEELIRIDTISQLLAAGVNNSRAIRLDKNTVEYLLLLLGEHRAIVQPLICNLETILANQQLLDSLSNRPSGQIEPVVEEIVCRELIKLREDE
jgi:hypothetical protein